MQKMNFFENIGWGSDEKKKAGGSEIEPSAFFFGKKFKKIWTRGWYTGFIRNHFYDLKNINESEGTI